MYFHHYLVHLLTIFLLTASATPLSFDFPSFRQSNSLNIEGDASVGNDNILHLTNVDQSQTGSIGRVTYPESFLLRQNSTGKLADFTTHFTFVINPPATGDYGLVFFLAQNGSLLDEELGTGGSMGLPVNRTGEIPVQPANAFVAVEFDTYRNQETTVEDPFGDHIGIDVNSLDSIRTQQWSKFAGVPQQNSATISYNSVTKNLSVTVTTSAVIPGNAPEISRITYLYQIVDLTKSLLDRVIVGFSAATGVSNTSHDIVSWTFTSTLLVDPEPLPPPSTPSSPQAPKKAPDSLPDSGQATKNQSQVPSQLGPNSVAKSKKPNIPVLIAAVVLSTAGVFLLLGGFICLILCIKNRAPGESHDDEDPLIRELRKKQLGKDIGPRQYSYKELEAATFNFSDANRLGGGGFGYVYKGSLKSKKSNNCEVAVKKLMKLSEQGPKEYEAEIRILSTLRHRNLVQLLGWCHENEALLLVYEFMPNGSLDSHLFKGKSLLSWESRYKIAQALASVLRYIQHEWVQYVVHRDIKSSNIMLDSELNPKLGDFGLARLVDHDKSSKTTLVAGTIGYLAPEYDREQKASKIADIFSFGVVALEIACGRKPNDSRLGEERFNMVKWVWGLHNEGRVIEAADPKLNGNYDRRQMECLLIVGLWCSHPDKTRRPTITQVIDVLDFKNVDPFPHIPEPAERSIYLTSSDEFQIAGDSTPI